MVGEPGLTVGGGRHVDRLSAGTRLRRLAWKSGGMVLVAVACLCRALAQLHRVKEELQSEGYRCPGTAMTFDVDPAVYSRPCSCLLVREPPMSVVVAQSWRHSCFADAAKAADKIHDLLAERRLRTSLGT